MFRISVHRIAATLLLLCAAPVPAAVPEVPAGVLDTGPSEGLVGRLVHRFVVPQVIEAEALMAHQVASAGPVERQAMAGFGPNWGGDAQLFWRPPAPEETPIRNWPSLRLYPQANHAGRFKATLMYTAAPDYGKVRIFIKGQPVKDYDGYAPGVVARKLDLGEFELAGSFEMVFTVFGKNAASGNFFVGLDRIELMPVE